MTEAEYLEASSRYRALFERGMDDIRQSSAPSIQPELHRAMFYSIDVGGKRIRPCLLLSACEALGGSVSDALPFACALEMIHTYSLIHDDLPAVDNDDMRRGKPANHTVFGEGMAVFAGCGLLSLAVETMTDACIRAGRKNELFALREIVSKSGAEGMLSGQAADLRSPGSSDEGLLHYIHRHKTADMLEAAVVAGAFIAGADDDTLSSLRVYSQKLGLLFQITDDILDVCGDEKLMGKTLGKDAEEDKLTFVKLYGRDGAQKKAREASDEALEALSGIENGGYLAAAVHSILSRSN